MQRATHQNCRVQHVRPAGCNTSELQGATRQNRRVQRVRPAACNTSGMQGATHQNYRVQHNRPVGYNTSDLQGATCQDLQGATRQTFRVHHQTSGCNTPNIVIRPMGAPTLLKQTQRRATRSGVPLGFDTTRRTRHHVQKSYFNSATGLAEKSLILSACEPHLYPAQRDKTRPSVE